MPPTIHLIRHAQGLHNISAANQQIRDPSLTDHGITQCTTLQSTFPHTSRITLLIASPLRRTIYTALHTFSPLIQSKGLQIITLPEIQETSDLPADTGSEVEKLKEEFKDQPVGFELLEEGWWEKTPGAMAEPRVGAILSRAASARRYLRSRLAELSDNQDIAVVTHGGFLHYFTDDWEGVKDWRLGSGWANTEWRSYVFAEGDGEEAKLVETRESRERRRGEEKPLTEAEQRNLRETGIGRWVELGYVKGDGEEKAVL